MIGLSSEELSSKPAERSVGEFVLALFAVWEKASIPFVVLRNYEGLPHSIGNDLDVLVAPKRLRDAERLLLQGAMARGWNLGQRLARCLGFSPITFYFYKRTSEEVVHVDLFRNLCWRGLEYLDAEAVLSRKRRNGVFYVPHPLDEAAINLLVRLLYGGYVKDKYKGKIESTCLDDPRGFYETLANRFGERAAAGIGQAVQGGRWEAVKAQATRLRFHLLVHNLAGNPVRVFRTLASDAWRLSRRLFRHPPGGIIAIVGPDGVGKSSTVQKFLGERGIARLFNVINGTALRHWRPGLLPPLGSFVGRQGANPGVPQPPRRTPGRFQAFRLAYYWIDFVLGHLLRDRLQTIRSCLLVYDRCALDTAVDPVRYGLRSARGTMLLWKLIPKPKPVVLLYDTPERIVARKAELGEEEVAGQLKTWLRLTEQGHVDAIIRVDAQPEEIARRIQDLLVDEFIRMNGGDLGAKLRAEEAVSTLSALLSGTQSSPFVVVPSKRRPRFLIPLAPRRAAAASLKVYNPHKPLARLAKHLLGIGLRTGLAQPFLPTQRTSSAGVLPPVEAIGGPSLQDYLSDVLGEKNLLVAVSLGIPGPHRKPVLQLMNPRGATLGYAKVGWNEQTIELVRREEAVLTRLGDVRFSTAIIPKVLHAGWWNGSYVLVEDAPAGSSKPSGHVLTQRHLEFWRELRLATAAGQPAAGGSIAEELRRRIAALQERGLHYYPHLLTQALARCLDQLGDAPVQRSFKHGDFTPWNILAVRDKLFVFDWEYAEESALPGWDLFHFIVQTGVLVGGYDGRKILKAVRHQLETQKSLSAFLRESGVHHQLVPALFFLYVADVMSWYLLRDADATDEKGQKMRGAWAYLLTMAGFQDSAFAWNDVC